MSDSATPWPVAYQVSPSTGFSRQEYWSGLPFPSPGDLSNTGIKPRSPALQADALQSEPPEKPSNYIKEVKSNCLTHYLTATVGVNHFSRNVFLPFCPFGLFPIWYSCLKNPMDGGAWLVAVHGVAKSRTQLSDFTFTYWSRKWQHTPVFLSGES